MKTRVISSIIYMTILLLLLFFDIPMVDTIIVVFISALGIYEYNKAFKTAGYNPIGWIGYAGCLMLFMMGGWINNIDKMLILRIIVPTAIIVLFMYLIITNLKRNVVDLMITGFSLAFIPFMFSFVKLILLMENGRILIWYVLLGAFISDTFAYFVGSKFGKHKLCPKISPNKTIEGSLAGIIGVVISYIILTYIVNRFFALNINMWLIILTGVIAAIVGQFGDLAASSIKRFCNIKDFGSIMPGHGGILDRCDSILFVAPVVYMILKIYML